MNTSGVVKAMSNKQVKTRFGMKDTYSFNIDDQWYSLGFKKPKFGKGDTIEFEYTESTYGMQVDDKTVVVKGGGSSAPTGAVKAVSFGGGGKGVFPIPALDGQRAIVRQNALTNARELYCYCAGSDAKFNKETAADIIAIARIFESYACGDLDAAEAKKMMEKAAKKAEPKPIEELLDEEAA